MLSHTKNHSDFFFFCSSYSYSFQNPAFIRNYVYQVLLVYIKGRPTLCVVTSLALVNKITYDWFQIKIILYTHQNRHLEKNTMESSLFMGDQCPWLSWVTLAHEFTSPYKKYLFNFLPTKLHHNELWTFWLPTNIGPQE